MGDTVRGACVGTGVVARVRCCRSARGPYITVDPGILPRYLELPWGAYRLNSGPGGGQTQDLTN